MVATVWLVALFAVIGATAIGVGAVVQFSARPMVGEIRAALASLSVLIQFTKNGGGAMAVGPKVAGGVAARDYFPLAALPRWKQTGGLLPDGNLDPQQWNDCGETCVAGIVAAVHGVDVSPGDVRESLGGPQRSGLTTAVDLVTALQHFEVAASVLATTWQNAWLRLRAQWVVAMPVIMLGNWLSSSSLHWVTMVGMEQGGVRVIDPYTGTERVMLQAEFTGKYAGFMVLVNAHLHYDKSATPTPGT